ncbi:MFS transporter [Alicyclobacillus sp. SO9]|uniref:MFS transporter n=1 Tax=Alicyclobacillus sp. SO9 TaxID=2665646 RepID=UPI0018E82C48|nr:MFS transporter [Alicyclobacillus sp. SO9]QQE79142.1 MFS transporter [Alicyclobacillus sp. SO9]
MKKIVFLGIAMIAVCYAFARFSFGLFLPSMARTLGLTVVGSGLIASASYIAYCAALITSTFVIYKTGCHTAVRLAGISTVIGLAGITFSGDAVVLAGSVFVAGLGTGWASPAFGNIAAAELTEANRHQGNTWINSGTSFGIILSGPIALFFSHYWRQSYALFTVISLAVLVWNVKAIPQSKTRVTALSLRELRTSWRRSIPLITASLLMGISSSIYWTFSRDYITVHHHISYTVSIWFWITMGASGILGGLAGGIIGRIGMQGAYVSALFSMSAAIALLTSTSVSLTFLSGVLFGITYIFLTGVFIVWGTNLFPENPAIGISLSFLLLGIGQTVGTALAGLSIAAFSYTTSFLLFAFVGLVGLVVRTNSSK